MAMGRETNQVDNNGSWVLNDKVSNSALKATYGCSQSHKELVPCGRGRRNAAQAVSSHLGPKSHCVTSTQSDESVRHQPHASGRDRSQSAGMCQTYLVAVMNYGVGLVSPALRNFKTAGGCRKPWSVQDSKDYSVCL